MAGSEPATAPPCDSTPTRASLGTASLSTSSLLVIRSNDKVETPVMLPPGRARLATRPNATGSPARVITMGMVVVAFFAANATPIPETTMRSTLRRTNSAARSDMRSGFCSANRYSVVMFFPSIQPSLLSSCRNTSTSSVLLEAVLESRKPMQVIFPVCCARAKEALNSRAAATRQVIIFVFIVSAARLSDHLVRPCKHVGWNRHADLFGGLKVDDEVKLRRLFDRNIGWFGSLQ